jgi:hypothetical protein
LSEHINEISPGFADPWAAGCCLEHGTRQRGCRNTGLRAAKRSDRTEPEGDHTAPSDRQRRQAERG